MTINLDNAKKAVPADGANRVIFYKLTLKDGKTLFKITEKQIPGMLALRGAQNETETFRLHPDRPVTINALIGIQWTITKTEDVERVRRIPKTSLKNVQEYDMRTKQYRYVLKNVTEYEDEKYKVREQITRSHHASNPASFTFIPEKDAVYLIDYRNIHVTNGCSMNVYKQVPDKNGTFKMIPVAEYIKKEI